MSTFHENLVQSFSNFKTKYITPLRSNVDDIFNINGAKNILPYDPSINPTPYSGYGVTISRNEETEVFTINGTSTDNRVIFISNLSNQWLVNRYVGMKLNITGTNLNNFHILIRYYESSSAEWTDYSKQAILKNTDDYVIEDYPYVVFSLEFMSNIVFDNDTLSIMLRSANVSDNTYQPFTKTNRQLTVEKANRGVLDNFDLNRVRNDGIYFVMNSCTNTPPMSTGTLIVSDGHASTSNVYQTFIATDGATYGRYSTNNGLRWTNWSRLSNSVSVTADGVKTYKTLFNELYALIDKTKITKSSVITYNGEYFRISFRSFNDTNIICTAHDLHTTTSSMLFYSIQLNSTDSFYRGVIVDSTGQISYNNYDTSVPSSGKVFNFYYNS